MQVAFTLLLLASQLYGGPPLAPCARWTAESPAPRPASNC